MNETLVILEKVNAFYSNAWTQLIGFAIVIFGVVGFIVPIIVQLMQNRAFKSGKDEIIKQLMVELEVKYKQQEEKIKEENKKALEEIRTSFEKIELKLEKQIACADAGTFHLQGNDLLYNKKYYSEAAKSYIKAISNYLYGDDEDNCRCVLNLLSDDCLPKLKKKDFKEDLELKEKMENFINELEKYNINGRYKGCITVLKQKVADIKI